MEEIENGGMEGRWDGLCDDNRLCRDIRSEGVGKYDGDCSSLTLFETVIILGKSEAMI